MESWTNGNGDEPDKVDAVRKDTIGSSLSAVERNVVLRALEVCADSLVVHRNTLKQEATREEEKSRFLEIGLYVSGVIRDLRREISKHGTVDVLRKEIERKSTLREKQERLLAEENERTRAIAMELRARILDEKTSNEREKERLTSKLNSKRDEKQRLRSIKDVETRYVRAWEKARQQQNVLRYELQMDEWKKTLDDYHVRERNENRVNGELTRYLTRRIAFIGHRMQEWQQRYEREREMHEEQIRKVRNEIEEARKYLGKLTTEYRSNKEFIDMYLAEQEALRRQKRHEDHVRRSTIRLQAWWRGIMVRRKLGPYRPEEKKKKRTVKTKKHVPL